MNIFKQFTALSDAKKRSKVISIYLQPKTLPKPLLEAEGARPGRKELRARLFYQI